MPDGDQPTKQALPIRLLSHWGALWLALGLTLRRVFHLMGGVSYLIHDVIVWIWRGLFNRRVRIGRTAIATQMFRVGVRSTFIIMLVSGSIGFILAMQMAPPLEDFGQQDKIANIIGVAIFRELGPLIAAIVLTGFAGAAISAELGTMKVGEEIEALWAHALNPIRFLVVPRVIATTVCLVLLTVLSDVTGVLAGGVMTVVFLGVPLELYQTNTLNQLVLSDFLTGLIKAAFFGMILASIACYNGLRVTGGAAGVGRATTDTVVQTVVSVILADLVFTAIFLALGWA